MTGKPFLRALHKLRLGLPKLYLQRAEFASNPLLSVFSRGEVQQMHSTIFNSNTCRKRWVSCCNNCLKLQFPIWQVKSFKVRIQNVEKEELQTSRSLFPVGCVAHSVSHLSQSQAHSVCLVVRFLQSFFFTNSKFFQRVLPWGRRPSNVFL